MGQIFKSIADSVSTTLTTFWNWLQILFANPLVRNILLWTGLVLVLALIAFVITRAIRRLRAAYIPELLVSKGEIQQLENSLSQTLNLKTSNLNEFPVQLLEITIKSNLMTAPIMIEAVELMGPHESVELEATLPHAIAGDNGLINVYAYVTKTKKLYRLKARFDWEPWAGRYKVSPLGQVLQPTRKLESSQLQELHKRAWHNRYAKKTTVNTLLSQDAPGQDAVALAEPHRREGTIPQDKPERINEPRILNPAPLNHRKADLDFPSEF